MVTVGDVFNNNKERYHMYLKCNLTRMYMYIHGTNS